MHLISPIMVNLCSQVGAYSVQKGIHGLEDTPRVSDSAGEEKDTLKDDLNRIRNLDKWIDDIRNDVLIRSWGTYRCFANGVCMKPAEVAFVVDRESFQEIGLQEWTRFTTDPDRQHPSGVHSLSMCLFCGISGQSAPSGAIRVWRFPTNRWDEHRREPGAGGGTGRCWAFPPLKLTGPRSFPQPDSPALGRDFRSCTVCSKWM